MKTAPSDKDFARSYSVDTKTSASLDQKGEQTAIGQRGNFITIGSGGSKVAPSFSAEQANGLNLWVVAAAVAGAVLFFLLRKRKGGK